MLVSIFKDLTFATGADHSYTPPIEYSPEIKDEETGEVISEEVLAVAEKGHPDCISCQEISFDPKTETIEVTQKKGKILVNIIPLPVVPENPQEKHSRIYQSILTTESLDGFDLEGEIFSDFEIGEIIMAHVFGGNPHAKSALDAKLFVMLLSGIPNPELIQKAQEIETKTNAIRNIFNLGNLL